MPSAPAADPLSRVALACLRVYKILISPLFAGSCRFVPSCADYAAEAIGRFGVTKGSWLAVRRLARCHPLCPGGHDPVPTLESTVGPRSTVVKKTRFRGWFATVDRGLRTVD